uniref:Uncharacterized protein n=1 Tax=viral metagenome TaxID=1070528 RepID=A0A6C0IYU9_9ZZZZ
MTNSRLKTFNIPRMMKSESLDEKKIELSQSHRYEEEEPIERLSRGPWKVTW